MTIHTAIECDYCSGSESPKEFTEAGGRVILVHDPARQQSEGPDRVIHLCSDCLPLFDQWLEGPPAP